MVKGSTRLLGTGACLALSCFLVLHKIDRCRLRVQQGLKGRHALEVRENSGQLGENIRVDPLDPRLHRDALRVLISFGLLLRLCHRNLAETSGGSGGHSQYNCWIPMTPDR